MSSRLASSASPVGAPLGLVNLNPAAVPLVVKGAASQSASLQEWQDSTGAVVSRVRGNDGALCTQYIVDKTGVTSPFLDFVNNVNTITIRPQSASQTPLTVKGAASQTADLQQWQSSTGSVMAKIDAFGNTVLNTVSTSNISGLAHSTGSYFAFGSTGPVTNQIADATTIGLVTKAAASQSADLQQWQSSTSAVLARVDSSGAIAPQNGARITSGSGAPTTPGGINPTAGDVYHRKDTPGVAMQNIYKCTVGGATPTWVALV